MPFAEPNMSANPMRKSASEGGTVIPFPRASAPLEVKPATLRARDRVVLEAARWWVIKSKLTARAVAEEACFILAQGMACETSAYATAFFRLVDIHAKRRLHFFTVGIETITRDERWFLQLIRVAVDDDHESVAALLGWRLEASAQRRAAFLIGQLAQILRKKDLESGENVII